MLCNLPDPHEPHGLGPNVKGICTGEGSIARELRLREDAMADAMIESARAGTVEMTMAALALAAIVADVLDGANIKDVADELPTVARRLVMAYRHQSGPLAAIGARPSDQFGPLPFVPPRARVMCEGTRTVIDVDPAAKEISEG